MAIYFEKREYPKQELASLLGIKKIEHNSNLRKLIINRMKTLGFEEGRHYSFPRCSKKITILWIPQTPSEKIIYLVRLFGIDTRVDPYAFALFLYSMIVTEDLQAMPWEERASFMKDNWDIKISSSTLCSSWGKKLLTLVILTKDKREGMWWRSMKIGNEMIREPMISEEQIEAAKNFWKEWYHLKKTLPNKRVFTIMWGKYECTYYKCPKLVACAWNEPLVEELMQAVDDYVQEMWSKEI